MILNVKKVDFSDISIAVGFGTDASGNEIKFACERAYGFNIQCAIDDGELVQVDIEDWQVIK